MVAMRLASFVLGLAQGQELFLNARAPEAGPNRTSHWKALTQLLQGWQFTTEYAVTIGDHTGELYRYEGGNFTLGTEIPTGSTSKWPSAMMFAGAVDDGSIRSLDTPVNEYVSWWTKNASDPRSEVTMRMLLSFTSGFGDGAPGEEFNSRAARQWRAETGMLRRASLEETDGLRCNATTGDITECAQSIYETVKLVGKPGKVYSYNSNHLQLAAAVVMAATGLDLQQVIQKYLIKPYAMTDSFYFGKCPDMAANLITTGRDYGRFLDGVFNKKVLSRAMTHESERDYTSFLSGYSLYGNYAFGHFLMCFDSVKGMTQECREARSHMDPGAYGFIPIIDRKYGYYMQLVSAEIAPTGSYPLSGIPEYLAVAMKPVVEAIMSGNPPEAYEFGFHTPRYLSLSVADVNYCLGCRLNQSSCE